MSANLRRALEKPCVREASGSKESASASSNNPREFIKSDQDLPRYILFDNLAALLYNQPDNITWAELWAPCTTLFNHLHPLGRRAVLSQSRVAARDLGLSILWYCIVCSRGRS